MAKLDGYNDDFSTTDRGNFMSSPEYSSGYPKVYPVTSPGLPPHPPYVQTAPINYTTTPNYITLDTFNNFMSYVKVLEARVTQLESMLSNSKGEETDA